MMVFEKRTLQVVEDIKSPPEIDGETDLPWLHAQIMGIGSPSYFHHRNGGTWSIVVEVQTDNPAVSAEVKSGHGYKTLTEAMRALLEKCR